MIECVVKSYLCHETNPDIWGQVQLAGLELLTRRELEWYREPRLVIPVFRNLFFGQEKNSPARVPEDFFFPEFF